MKTSHFIVAVIALLLILAPGCCLTGGWIGIRGEGPVIERKLDIRDFKGVNLGNSAQVFLIPGERVEVRVEGQENIIENLKREVEGDVWDIGFKRPVSHAETLRIYITMDQLRSARISGPGNITGRGLFDGGQDLDLGVSGSGNINLEVEAD
ncbi:MAG: DUF2807 domain-containing protein, partial [Bacteroidales bacterium]